MSGQAPAPMSVMRILGLILRHGQNLLVYPAAFDYVFGRRPSSIHTPAMFGIPYMAPLLRTADKVDLSCYLLPQSHESLADDFQVPTMLIEDSKVDLTPAAAEARATVIMFHGNSAHHWEDIYSAKDLFKMKCNVFLLSYRGYSLSGGSPSEKGLRIDAQTALDYILDQPYLAQAPIILYGHSLGGGVAIDLASRNPSKISGVIVSNTFTSIPDIVRRWPYIGVFSFVCNQKWRSARKMHHIPTTTPILMVSGRRDEVIPPELMDKLWEAARKRGEKRRSRLRSCTKAEETPEDPPAGDIFVTIETGTHNNTPDFREYWKAIKGFVHNVAHRAEKRTTPVETTPAPPTLKKGVDRRWRYIDMKLEVVDEDKDS